MDGQNQTGCFCVGRLLWTALVTLPLISAVQEICDRTAAATSKRLGALADERFRRWRLGLRLLIGLLIVANGLNVAADVAAVGEGINFCMPPRRSCGR